MSALAELRQELRSRLENRTAKLSESPRIHISLRDSDIALLLDTLDLRDEALRNLWMLYNDPRWCKMKADYLRGHLSYASELEEKEGPIRAVLPE